jgi:SRSO17 transposase
MANHAVGVTYHRLHHFLTEAPWSASQLNSRRLEVMNQCSKTRISRGFSLIVDDSGHRKSGNFTAGVGRQYIGEIGKTPYQVVHARETGFGAADVGIAELIFFLK